MFTIRRVWHYGNDYHVTLHTGRTLLDALMDAAPNMPDSKRAAATMTLAAGDAYDGWSWMRLELI